ncbi:MAG: M20/M25/M40 family metallo-hydrolase, partial [Lachnospiraceae bacterium]|nr:M20/M25/M40 family metallo-hydrolase [Lachnospiraceae bacterium]
MASVRADKCTDLFARIDALEKKYIDFLIDVCKIESPTEYKEGVDRVGRYFIEKAKALGCKIEVLKQPVSGDCVCITLNPEVQAHPVVFSAHMDTVHPVGFFGEEIVTWDEEKIYGPGVTDCKGGAVAGFYAMAALEDQGFKARPVKLILQSDEEVSSCTSNKETIKFMARKAEDCVAFLNCEPHTKGMAVIGRKGISKYEFEVL